MKKINYYSAVIFLILIFSLCVVSASNECESGICKINNKSLNFSTLDLSQFNCENLLEFSGAIIGQEVPRELHYGNDILNFYLENDFFVSVQIQDYIIFNLSCEENLNSTYDVYVLNWQTVLDIEKARNQIQEISKKLDNKEIILKSHGFGKGIKLFFTKVILKVFV